jgi:hypothetical protein
MDQVASEAGLSTSQREAIKFVLVCRAYFDLTREAILNQPDKAERKRLQAAWKWLSRNQALLARVLSGKATPRSDSSLAESAVGRRRNA